MHIHITFICMYIYIYVYVCIYIYICTHIYKHIYLSAYLPVYISVSLFTQLDPLPQDPPHHIAQSHTSQGIGRQGRCSFCEQSLRFSTTPCRPMPSLVHF